MEPASILALVSVSLTIAHRLGATTRDVYDLYKTMKGITNSLELISSRNLIIRAALNQLKQWCSTALAKERLSSELSKALETALKTCNTVMEGISRRLSCVQKSRMIFARAKYVWIQRDLKDDADRLDGQISTLHFLVSILQL
jgi:hypothetical protein